MSLKKDGIRMRDYIIIKEMIGVYEKAMSRYDSNGIDFSFNIDTVLCICF